MNGAEALLHTLINAGVKTCFTNPGSTEMEIIREFDNVEGLRAVLCLFEGVATGAADGWGRMTGNPAFSLLHVGPGLGNGLANLHNAKRAYTPLLNIIGDYPHYHRHNEPLLGGDLETLAKPMSGWVRAPASGQTVAQDTADAIAAARLGQVATLIVPQDVSWADTDGPAPDPARATPPTLDAGLIEDLARRMASDDSIILLIGGEGLSEAGLAAAARVGAATGCRVLTNTFAARIERGAGRGQFGPMPGDQPAAIELFTGAGAVALAGAREPMANLAYPGYPGELIPPGKEIFKLAGPTEPVTPWLTALAEALDAPARGAHYDLKLPDLPTGVLDPRAVGAVLANLLPENAIVSAEATTSGGPPFGLTRTARPHSWLAITGGAIGQGMPVAVGAAVACPERKVICLQADGGGMYTNQALWTMAREGLDIVTIILSNQRYRILENEYFRGGVNKLGPIADSLFDLSRPEINWTKLSEGMGVPGQRCHNAEDFARQFANALSEPGPQLIEVMLAS